MRRTPAAFLALAFTALALAASAPARAGMEPCRPDDHEDIQKSFICDSGDGAARVIRNTASPSKRLALGWRDTGAPPTEQSSEDDPDIELLILRIKDGAILWKSKSAHRRHAYQ